MDERKYVVWYQGGSGGFLLAWLLQLSINEELIEESLNCFPSNLKDNSIEWKKTEITPPDIGIMCNSFYIVTDEPYKQLYSRANKLLQRVSNRDKKIYSVYDIQYRRLKYYFCNYIWRRATGEPEMKKPWDPSIYENYDGNLTSLLKITDLLYDPSRVFFITAPLKFLRLCEKEKNCGIGDIFEQYEGWQDADLDKNIYMSDLINNYKDKLNIFPIESVWQGTWQQHIEQFLNRQLTPYQQEVCRLLIKRWLDITPQSIKDEFNI